MDSEVGFVVFLMVFCVLFGVIGRSIGETKQQPMAGLLLGIFFGPVGLLVTLLLPYPPQARQRRHDDYDDDDGDEKRPPPRKAYKAVKKSSCPATHSQARPDGWGDLR